MTALPATPDLSPANGQGGGAQLMTPTELARFLRVDEDYLYDLRAAGKGPEFIKLGRHVRYTWPDVRAWLKANTHTSTRTARASAEAR